MLTLKIDIQVRERRSGTVPFVSRIGDESTSGFASDEQPPLIIRIGFSPDESIIHGKNLESMGPNGLLHKLRRDLMLPEARLP